MLKKRYLFIISLAIFLFSLNCIYANDNATDILTAEDNGENTLSMDCNVDNELLNYEYSIRTHDVRKIVGNGTQYEAILYDNDNMPLKNTKIPLEINGVEYHRYTDNKGLVKMNINLMPGEYSLKITNPVTSEWEISDITVLPNLINNHDLTKYCRGANQYYITALNDQGNVVSGQEVIFNIHGVFYTRISDENGRVKLNINLGPGEYIITAIYGIYKVSNKITVFERIGSTSSNYFKYYETGRVFIVNVLDDNGYLSSQNENVYININGVIYTRSLTNNGVAKLNINLNPGSYIATVDYKGHMKSFNVVVEENPYDANRPSYDDMRYKKSTFDPTNPAYYRGPYHIDEVINGWNPSEHEVSRNYLPNGDIEVFYDDDYFRIADSMGYVITYGFGR
ncbi:hypothetical protein [uncultured Methanobrevibacter sp.]|uniref:hypothetical protein n=1 Tax=uncultured Methanobrevibacter sp. TaxID=253161 RepID=UPI0025FA5B3B|nr:hypothetical protein [uncultured Methanobrevibacter sp.]